jgi:hypothetical protein
MRRTRLLVLPALLLTLTAACGGSSGKTETLSPAQAVKAASQTTAHAKSSKMAFTSRTTFGGRDISITGTGAFDYTTHDGTLSLQVPSALAGAIEERIVGGVVYVQLPNQPGVFYSVKVADLVGTSLGSSTDPASGLQALRGVSSDVTKVGSETVRGAETTHYKGMYDVQAALAKLTGPAKQLLTKALSATDLKSVPFDAYVDGQGRMRKFVQTFTTTAKGQQVKSTTTLELFDFDSPVTVTAPPAAQVKDGSALLAALKTTAA